MKTWTVTINFGGLIGCSIDYTFDTDDNMTEEDAIEEAKEMAAEDLIAENIECEE